MGRRSWGSRCDGADRRADSDKLKKARERLAQARVGSQAQVTGPSLELLQIAFAGLSEAVQRGEMRIAVSQSIRRTSALAGMVKIIFFTRLS